MDLGLSGKNLLITGGSSGIGKGIATVLAKEGVNLAVASRNPDPEAVEELKSYGTRVEAIRADVSWERIDRAATERFRDRYIPMRRFGNPVEVGGAVAFLLSDVMSSYVTGADIEVDGGMHLQPVNVITDEEIRAFNQAD